MADDFDYYVGWGYSPIDPDGWSDDNSGWVDSGTNCAGLRECSKRRVGGGEDPPEIHISAEVRKKWKRWDEEAKQKEKQREKEREERRKTEGLRAFWETYRFYWKKKRSPIYAS